MIEIVDRDGEVAWRPSNERHWPRQDVTIYTAGSRVLMADGLQPGDRVYEDGALIFFWAGVA